ncbi:MAG TPA: phosphotransferase, partial [Thermomicrobiales bacterium]|nr:phosphotransferase [Thermomicrobiales bacterium]
RDTLAAHGSPAMTNESVLLHGDYWPGNILWRDGDIAAVLDWEDAAIGDPVADLAGSRLELLWKFGPEVMESFTTHYLSRTTIDLADLPLWELTSASGAAAHMSAWGLDAAIEAEMREKAWWFMEQARQRLATDRSGASKIR